MSDTMLTTVDGYCVSQTTTTVDTSWVTDEMMERWAAESDERIAEMQAREANQDAL